MKKKKYNKLVFLAKNKLNSIKVLMSTPLIDCSIIDDELFSVNNVLKEYYDMKEKIETLKV